MSNWLSIPQQNATIRTHKLNQFPFRCSLQMISAVATYVFIILQFKTSMNERNVKSNYTNTYNWKVTSFNKWKLKSDSRLVLSSAGKSHREFSSYINHHDSTKIFWHVESDPRKLEICFTISLNIRIYFYSSRMKNVTFVLSSSHILEPGGGGSLLGWNCRVRRYFLS